MTRTHIAALLLALAGCSSVRMVSIETVPAGAQISVDGNEVGTSPLTYGFDFADSSKNYRVSTHLIGYVDNFTNLNTIYLEAKGESLKIKLDVDEAYQGTTGDPADQSRDHPLANQWVNVEANPLLNEADAWNRLVNTVTTRFNYKLAPGTEQKAGYLLSDPIVRGFRQGPDTARVTNVITCQRLSSSPVVFKVKVESIIDIRGKTTPYGRILKTPSPDNNGEELRLLDELRASLTAE